MKRHALVPSLLFSLCAVVGAQEDYTTWSQHKDLWTNTQPNGANVANTVTNFPVLVRLDTSNFAAGFAQSVGRGADLRFTKTDNATRLPHQIERWDSAGRRAEIWVLLDSVPGYAVKAFRMHWGKSGAADSSSGPSVFRTAHGFQAVWHMNGAAADSSERDATANGLTAVPVASPATVSGQIGGARNIANVGNTVTSYFKVPNSAAVLQNEGGSNFSISAWVNLNSQATHATLVSKHDNAYALKLDNATNWEIFEFNGGWNAVNGPSEAGVWTHVLGVVSGENSALYIDGVRVDFGVVNTSSGAARVNTYNLAIGAEPLTDSTFRRPFDGFADEIRLAGVARSADWARLEFQNQRSAQTLVAYSQPVALQSGAKAAGSRISARALGEGWLFSIPAEGATRARGEIVSLQGKSVWTRETHGAQVGSLAWNGRAASGARVPAGVYLLRVTLFDASGAKVGTFDHRLAIPR